MATTKTWTPSRRMQSAAFAERERLERELTRLESRKRALAAEEADVDAAIRDLAAQRSALNHFVDKDASLGEASPRLRAVPDEPSEDQVVLKGADIRRTAVRLLAGSPDARSPVHYKAWYELLRREGYLPAGKDPVATFLTQISRSPVVRRTSRAGEYELDFEFPSRVRKRLTSLRDGLKHAHDVPADADIRTIAQVRARRSELTQEVAAAERGLEEAVGSLGEDAA